MTETATTTAGTPAETYAFKSYSAPVFTIRMPKPNGWKMYLHGYGTAYATVFTLMDDSKPPCWFHRFMVKWLLGIVWIKEEVI